MNTIIPLPEFHPLANPQAVIVTRQARFTLLTPRLVRMEYSPCGQFEDRPSQAFWHRQQPAPLFTSSETDGVLVVETEALRLRYDSRAGAFSPASLQIELKESGTLWRCGDAPRGNLRGTYRTLDNASGRVELEPGLLSTEGWSVVDDSGSLVFDESGWLRQREAAPGSQDLYFFGYGQDYEACLRDYLRLTGSVPLIPRWALGNWWSRYWEYTQQDVMDLVEAFDRRQVPLSVFIIDMDWHLVQNDSGVSGWTGYTWNRDFFPDPAGLVAWLHQKKLKIALNLHPADGVQPHEADYAEMAAALGIDPSTRQPVEFAIENPDFARAYLEILHHRKEQREGIDFWWMDWQQGTRSGMQGLDPLWWLNHLHFYDLGRDGRKRPFIFSRWGGLGNHRYPIGFSGDAEITWESLAYQPYFTATAANVAYGWWSHDIGGHFKGFPSAELYTRWVQFGVFSPIFRLHSTKNAFIDQRPWGYDARVEEITSAAMRLRHRLVPYLYSMAWRNASQGSALVRPMYHTHPQHDEAYHQPHQYWFGSELIAAPVTRPADPELGLAQPLVWLPEGDWFDFFSGRQYAGGKIHSLLAGLEETPVFARAGAVVPLAGGESALRTDLPAELEWLVFPGADNTFALYEDDGESTDYLRGERALTRADVRWQADEMRVTISPAQGAVHLLPAARRTRFTLRGLVEPELVTLLVNGQPVTCDWQYREAERSLEVQGVNTSPADEVSLTARRAGGLLPREDGRKVDFERLLRAARIRTDRKQTLADQAEAIVEQPLRLGRYASVLSEAQIAAFLEILCDAGARDLSLECGEEKVILWNNQGLPGFRYHFAHIPAGWMESGVAESGALPRFRAIVPGELANRWGGPDWRLAVSLADMARFTRGQTQ